MTTAAGESRDPYSPRPIDGPTPVPLAADADLGCLDEAKILAAPADPADRPAWRAALHRWRREARIRTGYDPTLYTDPETSWASTAWNVAIVWLWDEVVRDWDRERFDADRLLRAYEDVDGLDAVVLWHAYPVIGIDERNQFDWYDVPGLADLVSDLHARGVRVFLNYNPWDVGTRRTGRHDAARLSGLLADLGADGVFLDTLKEGDPELLATMASRRPRPVLEGESRVPLVRIADHQASWAQWFADSEVPGVLRARWFEQRHQMHHTRRWNRDHGVELRSAWVNGAGVLLWDVVFGVRVDWSDGDRAVLREMHEAYGTFCNFFLSGEWEPLADLEPEATAAGIAGSAWRLGGQTLYTLANPTDAAYDGPVAAGVSAAVGPGGIIGVLDYARQARDAEVVVSAASVRPDTPTQIAAPRRIVPHPATGTPAAGSVRPVPGDRFHSVRWRQRETGLYEDAPYVEDWKPLPPRLHRLRAETRTVSIGAVAVDAEEVTNAEYADFLAVSGYRPLTTHRFLAHWVDGAPPPDREEQPVSFIDLEDARAFAGWRGARLATEDEWQAAAGEPGWRRGEPPLWEWTESEHRDGRTRWVILKGGSWFAASGSDWYVDGGAQDPEWALRFLLTQAGTGRSDCIGFRCTVDLPGEAS